MSVFFSSTIRLFFEAGISFQRRGNSALLMIFVVWFLDRCRGTGCAGNLADNPVGRYGERSGEAGDHFFDV